MYHHILNGRPGFLVIIIELLRFINRTCYKYHYAKFEIERSILTNLEIYVTCGRSNYRKASTLKNEFLINFDMVVAVCLRTVDFRHFSDYIKF